MFQIIYSLSPSGYKKWFEKHINYCDFKVSPVKLIGFFFMFSALIGFAVGFLGFLLIQLQLDVAAVAGVVGFLVSYVCMHLMMISVADSRANLVETILPDALQIISANMRSGLTPDRAILASARPEFGPLEIELKKVSKETISGKPFEESLRGITKNIKSNVLRKTVDLVIEGLAKGGSLTNLLDSIGDDVRQSRLMRGEIKSFVIMYGIFIFFASAIGAPLLYSVSTYMVETMSTLGSNIGDATSLSSTSTVSIFKFKASAVTTEFLIQYSSVAIIVTSIFGALLIGLVQEGTEKAGIRYIPMLMLIAFGVFFGSQFVLSQIFASFI